MKSTRPRVGRKTLFDLHPPPVFPDFPVIEVDKHSAFHTLLASLSVCPEWGWRAVRPPLQGWCCRVEKVREDLSSELMFVICAEMDVLDSNVGTPRVEH